MVNGPQKNSKEAMLNIMFFLPLLWVTRGSLQSQFQVAKCIMHDWHYVANVRLEFHQDWIEQKDHMSDHLRLDLPLRETCTTHCVKARVF